MKREEANSRLSDLKSSIKTRRRISNKRSGLDKMDSKVSHVRIVIALVVIAIVVTLVNLMLINNEEYQEEAVSQQLTTETLTANRGTIYDANGEELVRSGAAWVVTLSPGSILDDQREELCQKLADILDLEYSTVLARSNLNSSSAKLFVKADKEQKDELVEYIYRDAYVRTVKAQDDNGNDLGLEEAYVEGEYVRVVKSTNDAGEVTSYEEAYLEDQEGMDLTFTEDYEFIKGVSLSVDTQRYYLQGTLASTVLGFTNFDNVGSAGIESYYNDTLKGVDGKVIKAQNSVGGEMPFDYETVIDAEDGDSLVLTIDANIQSILEKYLEQAVEDNDVQNRAVGIIMNVNTGAILAMATKGDYDPADYLTVTDEDALKEIAAAESEEEKQELTSAAQQEQWRNKAVSDTYEPGSVFKPITMAAALEEGVTSLSDTFYCPGYKVIAGNTVRCHKSGGHGTETLTEGMMNSCNPVFMTLGERLGAANFYKYFSAFGFTSTTGIDLPGEAAGVVHSLEGLGVSELASSTFGQTFTVTPIQMITAFAATVNGGYVVQPYVVDKVLDSNGNIVSSHETVVKSQVISESTSAIICEMLEATVGTGGTAHNVYISGYRIGAKTGTSEKVAELATTGERKYVASFCAIVPADDPEIAVLVILDEPNNPVSHGGGTIVAPVVRNILQEVLPYIGIDAVYSDEEASLIDTIVPNVVGNTVDEATETLTGKGLSVRIIGDGDTVTAQIPAASRSAPKSSTIVLSTEEDGEIPTTTVPELVGKSPTQVAAALQNSGLNIRYSGTGYDSSSGVATSQDIPAGSKVEQGTVVTVEFSVEGITD